VSNTKLVSLCKQIAQIRLMCGHCCGFANIAKWWVQAWIVAKRWRTRLEIPSNSWLQS